jgi:hypothetical protein
LVQTEADQNIAGMPKKKAWHVYAIPIWNVFSELFYLTHIRGHRALTTNCIDTMIEVNLNARHDLALICQAIYHIEGGRRVSMDAFRSVSFPSWS